MLGSLKRNTKHFHNTFTLITLFKLLVLPHLENCTPIWSPSSTIYSCMIERVQRKFIKYLHFKFHISYSSSDYLLYVQNLNLQSLYYRRFKFQLKVVLSVYSTLPPYSNFTSLIQSHVPPRLTRSSLLYNIPRFNTSLIDQHPVYSLLQLLNKLNIPLTSTHSFILKQLHHYNSTILLSLLI